MPELLELAERLRTVRHFQHFGLPDLLEIIQSGNVRRFREAEMIFRQDEPCAGMHVLIHGLVRLCKYGPQGQMIIIKIIRPVIMFNEVAVLDGGVNPVCAQAAQDSLVWQIGFDSFQRLLHRYPEIGIGLLRVLASRNRQMIAHFEDLSFRTVQARLAKLLLELSENSQAVIHRKDHSIAVLAARIASVPEAVSRSLSELSRRRIIHSNRYTIHVLDAQKLGEIAQVDSLEF